MAAHGCDVGSWMIGETLICRVEIPDGEAREIYAKIISIDQSPSFLFNFS